MSAANSSISNGWDTFAEKRLPWLLPLAVATVCVVSVWQSSLTVLGAASAPQPRSHGTLRAAKRAMKVELSRAGIGGESQPHLAEFK